MSRAEFMSKLRQALSGLPDEEIANALRYYEEYFDDAGPEREYEAAAELGDPQKAAGQILADYREVATVPPQNDAHKGTGTDANASAGTAHHGTTAQDSPKKKGINPVLLIILMLFALPILVPLAAAFLGILIAVLAVLAVIGIVIAIIPVCMLVAGVAFVVFSFFVWNHPASALVTLGSGLGLLGVGILAALLLIKLCTLFVPPLFRGFIAILRWPIDKIRGI